MLPSLHNIFPDQVKKSDTLFLLLSYSSTPRHTVLHQEADKLYPAQISSAAFFHSPITCHNIQSFKRKQIQKRLELGEKFKNKYDDRALSLHISQP